MTKAVTETKGPFLIFVNVGWMELLGIIADGLAIQRADLVVTSFEWHWVKPASSPWLPVQDENGFMSMLKKIRSNISKFRVLYIALWRCCSDP
jgi:hypothetical protein